MDRLITILVKWVTQKLVTLLVIILVLIGVLFLVDHWQDVEAKKQALVEYREKIEEERGALARLEEKLAQASAKTKAWLAELKSLEDAAEKAESAARKAKEDYLNVKKETWFFERPLWSDRAKREAALKIKWETAKEAAELARSAANAFRKTQDNSEAADLADQVAGKKQEISQMEDEASRQQMLLDSDWLQRGRLAVWKVLPTALWILLGIIVAPVMIKLFLYFCVAPFVDRIGAVRIVPEEPDSELPVATDSDVSHSLEVAPGQELLIHPDFLQSVNQAAERKDKPRTRILLNPKLPFTSLASGMAMLTAIRPGKENPTKVVVSPTKDPLGELGLIELAEGDALIVHPRALAGVLQSRGNPIRITSHWRFGNLHSWLTFQFRFLRFHGPCTLILKGCRGVRAEQPDPERPRLINQSATLGFSPHLNYSNTRCETFMSYLRGKEDLFNDLFGGEKGIFVYEEMPDERRKTGLTGRGLEGVLDGFLKAFGI